MWVGSMFFAAGYASLWPLGYFSEFNPWWWLPLGLLGTVLIYIATVNMLQGPFTKPRWIGIGVAACLCAVLALQLGEAAMRTWPWWMWLVATLVMAVYLFLMLDVYKDLAVGFSTRNRKTARWIAIVSMLLLALFMLGNLVAAGIRDWSDQRDESSLQESRNMVGASVIGEDNPAVAPAPVETLEDIEALERSVRSLAERAEERITGSCETNPQVEEIVAETRETEAVTRWIEMDTEVSSDESLTGQEKIELLTTVKTLLEDVHVELDEAGCP